MGKQRSNAKSNGQHAAQHDQRATSNDAKSNQKLVAKSSSENDDVSGTNASEHGQLANVSDESNEHDAKWNVWESNQKRSRATKHPFSNVDTKQRHARNVDAKQHDEQRCDDEQRDGWRNGGSAEHDAPPAAADFLQLSIQMMSARFQQPGMTHSSQAAVQSASMMFNQGADPALGQNPKADPSQSYAQTVDGL